MNGDDDLVPSRLFFRGEDRSKESNSPSIYGVRERKRGSSSAGCAGELLLTTEPDPLSQNTKVKKNVTFSFWGVLSESV